MRFFYGKYFSLNQTNLYISLLVKYMTNVRFTLLVPDGKPVIGPVPGLPNVYLAAGHEGSGLSLVSIQKLSVNFR